MGLKMILKSKFNEGDTVYIPNTSYATIESRKISSVKMGCGKFVYEFVCDDDDEFLKDLKGLKILKRSDERIFSTAEDAKNWMLEYLRRRYISDCENLIEDFKEITKKREQPYFV